MDPERFRANVEQLLGRDLEHATYQNVRDFVAWFHDEAEETPISMGAYLLADEPDPTIESGIRRFLAEAMIADPEEARQRLWVHALELWYSMLESDDEESFGNLFADFGDDDTSDES